MKRLQVEDLIGKSMRECAGLFAVASNKADQDTIVKYFAIKVGEVEHDTIKPTSNRRWFNAYPYLQRGDVDMALAKEQGGQAVADLIAERKAQGLDKFGDTITQATRKVVVQKGGKAGKPNFSAYDNLSLEALGKVLATLTDEDAIAYVVGLIEAGGATKATTTKRKVKAKKSA